MSRASSTFARRTRKNVSSPWNWSMANRWPAASPGTARCRPAKRCCSCAPVADALTRAGRAPARPSRHQAREHHDRARGQQRRAGEADRLRPRQGARRQRRTALQACIPASTSWAPSILPARSRSTARGAARCAQRFLFAGRDALACPHRLPAFHRHRLRGAGRHMSIATRRGKKLPSAPEIIGKLRARDHARRLGPVDQHGADDEVHLRQARLDLQRRGEARRAAAVEQDLELAQAVDVAVVDVGLGAQADRDLGGVLARRRRRR